MKIFMMLIALFAFSGSISAYVPGPPASIEELFVSSDNISHIKVNSVQIKDVYCNVKNDSCIKEFIEFHPSFIEFYPSLNDINFKLPLEPKGRYYEVKYNIDIIENFRGERKNGIYKIDKIKLDEGKNYMSNPIGPTVSLLSKGYEYLIYRETLLVGSFGKKIDSFNEEDANTLNELRVLKSSFKMKVKIFFGENKNRFLNLLRRVFD